MGPEPSCQSLPWASQAMSVTGFWTAPAGRGLWQRADTGENEFLTFLSAPLRDRGHRCNASTVHVGSFTRHRRPLLWRTCHVSYYLGVALEIRLQADSVCGGHAESQCLRTSLKAWAPLLDGERFRVAAVGTLCALHVADLSRGTRALHLPRPPFSAGTSDVGDGVHERGTSCSLQVFSLLHGTEVSVCGVVSDRSHCGFVDDRCNVVVRVHSVLTWSAALLRLPSRVLTEILETDVLLVANEDIVFDFEAVRLEVPGKTPETAPLGSNVL